MSLLDTYKQKLETQLQEHKAHLDLLRAKARHVTAQGKIELAQADKHLAHAKTRFKELKGAGGSALVDLKAGLGKALADLKASSKKAARHFDQPPPKKKKKAPVKKAVARVVRAAKTKARTKKR
jgi:hypothetical protein